MFDSITSDLRFKSICRNKSTFSSMTFNIFYSMPQAGISSSFSNTYCSLPYFFCHPEPVHNLTALTKAPLTKMEKLKRTTTINRIRHTTYAIQALWHDIWLVVALYWFHTLHSDFILSYNQPCSEETDLELTRY